MANEKGFYDMQQPMKKTQPAKAGDHGTGCNYNGDGHDFNTKGKITNTSGSDYHDVSRKDSGLHGNFAEKDAQAAYLRERGKQGQVVKSWTGTGENNRVHTHNIGNTAYNSRPIDEVYKPATSMDVPPANAIMRSTNTKPENKQLVKSQKDLTKKI